MSISLPLRHFNEHVTSTNVKTATCSYVKTAAQQWRRELGTVLRGVGDVGAGTRQVRQTLAKPASAKTVAQHVFAKQG